MKHFSFKGPVDIDLRKEMFKFLLPAGCFGRFKGMTLGSITDNFNRHHGFIKSDETIAQVLASLGDMVKTTISENGDTLYSLKGNKPVYVSQTITAKSAMPINATIQTTGKKRKVKVWRSAKGHAKITLPVEQFKKLGEPNMVTCEFANDCIIIRRR
jgi:hypothetical protein